MALTASMLLCYVFFDSLTLGMIAAIPVFFLLRKVQKKQCIEKRKGELKKQFLSAVEFLADYLRSGYSVENGLKNSVKELETMYGKESDIVTEWNKVSVEMSVGKTPEDSFQDLGMRSRISEIIDFALLFSLVKRSGGQIAVVIRSYADTISQEFLVEEQLKTMIASKKFEQRVMDLMPVLILLYVKFSSPDLIAALYTTLIGRVVAVISLGAYFFGIYWGEKLTDIHM